MEQEKIAITLFESWANFDPKRLIDLVIIKWLDRELRLKPVLEARVPATHKNRLWKSKIIHLVDKENFDLFIKCFIEIKSPFIPLWTR